MECVCPGCGEEFDAEWSFGQDVTCTHCGKTWETDWDYTDSDGGYSVWVTTKQVPQDETSRPEPIS